MAEVVIHPNRIFSILGFSMHQINRHWSQKPLHLGLRGSVSIAKSITLCNAETAFDVSFEIAMLMFNAQSCVGTPNGLSNGTGYLLTAIDNSFLIFLYP